MPNSILWIGLVVLWVFVLFPMLAGRHPRIRQHTDAALATRVLHRGDTERRIRKGPASGHDTDPDYVPVRRKHHHDDPEDRMTRSDDSTRAESDDEDFDTARERDTESAVSAPEAVVADAADPVTEAAGDESESGTAEFDSDTRAPGEPDDIPGDMNDERPTRTAHADDAEPAEDVRAPRDGDGEPRRRVRMDAPPRSRVPALREPEPEFDEDEFDADDPDFVPSRRGRGGYDPEADAIARAARYTFRQRAVLGLVLSTLLFAGAGLAISATLWWLAAFSGTVLVGYLAYLRKQVRLEEDIRRRRAARLSRSRREDAEAEAAAEADRPLPDREETRTQLRRAVLVEPDDEDPLFEHLELFDAATARAVRERAAGRVRRAVGE
ncbi:gephyrin-like molybdotransferase receptor GlpR [Nocardia sp. NPDC056000]|uniref:divisome protein SepX/GlpR n=1 Tax=Nocardia sp. NPDC056000 TaxID=3345674 RepID=UPI0035D6A4FB